MVPVCVQLALVPQVAPASCTKTESRDLLFAQEAASSYAANFQVYNLFEDFFLKSLGLGNATGSADQMRSPFSFRG